MSSPVARYTVIVDRYLTDDCDGTGVLHDGSGQGAVEQLSKELQEAWDCGGVAGHFRVIDRIVKSGDGDLTGGYGCRGFTGTYEDDPEHLRPVKPQPSTDDVFHVVIDACAALIRSAENDPADSGEFAWARAGYDEGVTPMGDAEGFEATLRNAVGLATAVLNSGKSAEVYDLLGIEAPK